MAKSGLLDEQESSRITLIPWKGLKHIIKEKQEGRTTSPPAWGRGLKLRPALVKQFDVEVDNYREYSIKAAGKENFMLRTLDF